MKKATGLAYGVAENEQKEPMGFIIGLMREHDNTPPSRADSIHIEDREVLVNLRDTLTEYLNTGTIEGGDYV